MKTSAAVKAASETDPYGASMKKIFLAVVLTACFVMPVHASEMFGVEFGSDASAYDIGDKPVAVQGKMSVYKLMPPKPDADFPGYALTAYDGKVVRITAFSRADYSRDGALTQRVFRVTVDELKSRFGEPVLFDDALASDSKLSAPEQWRQSLEDRERILQSMWVLPYPKSDDLEAVWLEGNVMPQMPESASFLTLSARVKDYPAYEKKAALEESGENH